MNEKRTPVKKTVTAQTKKLQELLDRERRKSERLSLPVTVLFSRPPAARWTAPVSVADIGGGGIAFRCRERLPENAELRIRIRLERPPDILLKGEVRWCRKSGNAYLAGVKFRKMNSDDRRRFLNYFGDQIMRAFLGGKGELV